MELLFGLSIVFMAVAFLVRRPWTVALPFAIWLGLWLLGQAGILPGETSLESALLAGVVGAAFAAAGLLMGGRAAAGRPSGG